MPAGGRGVDVTIDCSGLGAGEATERLLGIAANEYKAVKVGANQFQFQRVYRPTWALVLGIILVPVLVGIILLVFVRATEQWVATVEEDHRSVRVRIHGAVLPTVLAALQHALGAGPAPAGTAPATGLTADPVGVHPGAMGSPLDLPPPTGTPTGTPLDLPPPTGTPIQTPGPVSSFAPPVAPPSGPPESPSAPAPPPMRPAAPATGRSVSIPPPPGSNDPPPTVELDHEVEETALAPTSEHLEPTDPPSGDVTISFDTGEVVVVEERTLIGRDPAPAPGEPAGRLIPIADADRSVSKTHLVVEPTDCGITVTDRDSTNGTTITQPDGSVDVLEVGTTTDAPFGSTVTFGQRSFTVERSTRTDQR